MTHTRDKLNEAKNFIEEMKNVYLFPDKFRYVLTAFLAASRSITLIMQKEFSKEVGFKDWYKQKQTEMRNNSTLKYLDRQRDISLHEHPVLQCSIISVIEPKVNSPDMSIFLTGTGSNINLSHVLLPAPTIKPNTRLTYYFDDMHAIGKDVMAICQEAITALEAIVVECETKFAIN